MKVYELMNRLEEMPSGATVRFNTTITQKQLKENGVLDIDGNGRNIYSVSGEIVDVDIQGTEVYLSD